MGSAQKPDKPWYLDAAFVVPLLIFIGYFWALSETIGEYTYFNVPYSFISLNPTTVLARASLHLAIIAYLLIYVVVPFLLWYVINKNSRLAFWILVCVVGIIISWAINVAFKPGKTLLLFIGVFLTVSVGVIASVYMDVVIAYLDHIRNERPSNSLPSTQLWNYVAILFTLGAILGGYFGFFYIGKSNAETEDTFFLVKQSGGGKEDTEYLVKQSGGGKEDTELVLLGTYGDYLVVVPFRRDTKKFESFVILKMPQGDNTRLTFTHEQVGRLERAQGKPAKAKP